MMENKGVAITHQENGD